jgi:hypothetical protein
VNGAENGIVWAIDYTAFGTGPAVLYAFDAANVANELYDSTQAGTRDRAAVAVKFTAPTVANGNVYIGGRNAVTVYGLLSTAPCGDNSPKLPAPNANGSVTVRVNSACLQLFVAQILHPHLSVFLDSEVVIHAHPLVQVGGEDLVKSRVANVARNGFRNDVRPRMILKSQHRAKMLCLIAL